MGRVKKCKHAEKRTVNTHKICCKPRLAFLSRNNSSPDGNYCFEKPCRLSQSEFIISYSMFMKRFSQPFSSRLRFKLRYESDDATERRYAQLLWSSFLMGLEKFL